MAMFWLRVYGDLGMTKKQQGVYHSSVSKFKFTARYRTKSSKTTKYEKDMRKYGKKYVKVCESMWKFGGGNPDY